MTYDMTLADILAWAATYDGPLFHALLCDPPYHLTEMTKRYSSPDAKPCGYGDDGSFRRLSRGFMNSTWDGGDIAFRPETWAALGKLLHPGAFCMAFASTRGFHRMAVAIEDAGFILHPVICWNFASGFPKATRLDVQIDRAAGVERDPMLVATKRGNLHEQAGPLALGATGFTDISQPATPLAQAWAGHRYGMQALKPAIELICVFQKPYEGRPVESITRTGAGAINIDQSRIMTDEDTARNPSKGGDTPAKFGYCADGMAGGGHDLGRWPANLILSHAPECNGTCAPGCPVAALGEQSGETTGDSPSRLPRQATVKSTFQQSEPGMPTAGFVDTGTAARFFFNADYALDRLEDSDPLIYVPKASTGEREAGLFDFDPTTVDDGREKPIDNPYQRGETARRNIHPTVKPISLARHLATLLLPPELYAPRRILIPFAGAGSEMIGAMLAGWEDVQGVELEAAHVEIARARLAFWQQMKYKLMNPDAPVKVSISRTPDGQTDMFESEAA